MSKKIVFAVLAAIVFLAGILRLYSMNTNPPSLTWDETAWGYNAYSLGLDGRDEFGRFLPFDYLESFGDYKPPMYAYLDVLPVKIFGLNEFATRFPSAIFGTFTVALTYFLVKRIFNKSKNVEIIALLSAFVLAISPWHIMLSRAAFEANVATFFLCFGIFSFIEGVLGERSRKWFLVLSAISFVCSMYTFNTSRVVAPILVIILAISFRKELLANKTQSIVSALVGILLFVPIFGFLLSPQAGLRFQEVNIFSDVNIVKTANQEIANDGGSMLSKLIHNRRILYSIEYIHHYFDNLSPLFLFIKGDGNPKFSIQTVGQMYLWDSVFFVAGILFLFRKREGLWWIIPIWLIVGIIPAATARETPHALRIETTLPTFQILVAYGFVVLLSYFKKWKKVFIAISAVLLFVNFVYFYHDYFANYKYDYSSEWQYGYVDSINYVEAEESKYDYVQVTQSLGRPYIYYLFYTKTDPNVFRKTAKITRDPFGFVDVQGFEKYVFPKNYTYNLFPGKKVLYITTPFNIPKNAHLLKTFYLLNGQPSLIAFTM